MARLISQVATTLRGSIGGITFSANQYHPIIARAKVSPVNPSTTYQTQIRTSFAGFANLWAQKTAIFRQAWEDYGRTVVFQGPFGPYTLSGRHHFIATMGFGNYYKQRGIIIGTVADDPPISPGRPAIYYIAPALPLVGATGFRIQIIQQCGEIMWAQLERSYAVPDSRQRFKGPWVPATAQSLVCLNGVANYAIFSGLVANKAYFVRVRGITAGGAGIGHRLTEIFYVRAIATVGV